MNRPVLFSLVGTALLVAFSACSIGARNDAGDDGFGGSGTYPGDGGFTGDGSVVGEDPDAVLVDGPKGLGGTGPGFGGSGGAGGSADLPFPDACLPFVDDPPVIVAVAPSDSHSTGSAAYALEVLSACQAPAPGELETSHFLNLHDLGYEHVAGQLDAQIDLVPTADPTLFIVQGAAIAGAHLSRPPVHLTFVVDTSSSTANGAMARQIAALGAVKGKLGESDSIALFGWSSTAVLTRTTGSNQSAIQSAIDALSTNADLDGALASGLAAAYSSSIAKIASDGEHSFVVMSDGGAQLAAGDQALLGNIASESRLSFVGVGVGPADSYRPALVRKMAKLAGGKLHYLGAQGAGDAQALFGAGFERLFTTAARSAVLQITMPAYFQVQEAPKSLFVGDVSLLRERALAPGGTIIFRQTVKVCDPAILLANIEPITGNVIFDAPTLGALDGEPFYMAPVSLSFPFAYPTGPSPTGSTEALITFADALRGPVSARLEAASAAIEASTAVDEDRRSQLVQLLKKHPNHPATECAQ